MNTYKNPNWWNAENDTTWNRSKAAFKRDWDQTKHNFGGNEPDTNQSVGTTVAQATGKKTIPPRGVPNYEEAESAYRYGYGARRHYGDQYSDWDPKVGARLKRDWQEANPGDDEYWGPYGLIVRSGWDSEETGEKVGRGLAA